MKISLISVHPDLQSFGIRSISACLKQEGHDVDLIFLQDREFKDKYLDKTMDDLGKLVKGSDLIGITLMTNFWDAAIQVTKKIRESSNGLVIWGGTHPTVKPVECLDYADMVCIGEGEETIMDLTRKMTNKQDYFDMKGMGFNNNGKKIINGHRDLPGSEKAEVNSLDKLPFQDHNYKSHFVMENKNIVKMNLELTTRLRLNEFYLTMPTRGCPFACTFCINSAYLAMHPHQKPIRKRSVDNIIAELIEAKKLPFTKIILFEDDAFFIMPVNEIKDFSIKYKKHIGIPLVITGATPSTLTKEKLSLLVDAGLVGMRMGIQTAGERTKKLYKRPHSNLQVEKAVKMVNDFSHIKAFYDIILDSPWDADEDSIETLMFLSKLPTPFQLSLFSLVFFPGTPLYTKAKEEGIVKDDVRDVYRKYFVEPKKTYLNDLFFLLRDYCIIGVGISPIIMSFLTNKWTKRLHLHRVSHKILKGLFPFFRTMGRKVRKSTRMYKTGWDYITKGKDTIDMGSPPVPLGKTINNTFGNQDAAPPNIAFGNNASVKKDEIPASRNADDILSETTISRYN